MTGASEAELRSLRDAAALFGAALVLGLLALTSPVAALDRDLETAVRGARTGGLTSLFQAISSLASPWAAATVVAAVAATAVLVPLPRGRVAVAGWTLAVMLGGWTLGTALRLLLSYPSTQVAFAMGCALAAYGLARTTRRPPLVVAVSTAGAVAVTLVGLSRLYLGTQSLTDVLGGILLSAAVAVLAEPFRPGQHHSEEPALWPQP